MKKQIKTILKKTAKVAGVTCVATGAIALVASGAAAKAAAVGIRYLRDTLQRIVEEKEPCLEEQTGA